MVARLITVVICDHCGSSSQVEKLQLRRPGRGTRQATFAACVDCRRAVPLEDWVDLIPRSPSRPRRGIPPARVLSEEEFQEVLHGTAS